MAMSFYDPELDSDLPDEEIILTSLRLVQEESEDFRVQRWESEESVHEFMNELQHKGLYAI